ncbi:alpha/beta fold hydrolase [Sinomonas mesophila]|uniref:alpha/beta fold hydrolase n=1 Tax=Sinomonas mesophila TaxID=1531955 RepID=UPI000986BC78|nr:alpha/beta fold hydrolase [Sinomonas mesophila]
MPTVSSADGTPISYSAEGSGPPLIMVHCVGVSRRTDPIASLPPALAEHFTVYSYDRRGKGESGNTQPYAVEREFEDLAAVIEVARGETQAEAAVFGFSSGATLALMAARAGLPISRLALLEPPFMSAHDGGALAAEFERILADDGPAAANRWYSRDIVGVPEEILEGFALTEDNLADAPAIVHELRFLPGNGPDTFAEVRQPTLLVVSDQTAPVMYDFAEALVASMRNVTYRKLPGQWHGIPDSTMTDALREFAGL